LGKHNNNNGPTAADTMTSGFDFSNPPFEPLVPYRPDSSNERFPWGPHFFTIKDPARSIPREVGQKTLMTIGDENFTAPIGDLTSGSSNISDLGSSLESYTSTHSSTSPVADDAVELELQNDDKDDEKAGLEINSIMRTYCRDFIAQEVTQVEVKPKNIPVLFDEAAEEKALAQQKELARNKELSAIPELYNEEEDSGSFGYVPRG